jgi:type II secretory pathway pseudopilin PulG
MIKRGKRIFFNWNHLGQVWIETVIYTLIAFVMIGLILSFVNPKIQQLQDQAILQQSTTLMKTIDSTILAMGAAGNQRILEIDIKKGDLKIDGVKDQLVFEMQSQALYSEPGKVITDGNIQILTQKESGYNLVTLTRDYSSDYDIKVDGADTVKTLSTTSTSYQLSILNEGEASDGRTILNMSVE